MGIALCVNHCYLHFKTKRSYKIKEVVLWILKTNLMYSTKAICLNATVFFYLSPNFIFLQKSLNIK